MTEKKKQFSGTVYISLAAILFSIGGLCIKMIPWGALAINGLRNLISVLIIGIYLWKTGHRIVLTPAVIFGALCMTGTSTLFVLANKLTTAANAIVLQFTAPVFVILLTWLFFKKKPNRLDVIASLVVIIGIVCFFVDGLSTGNVLGDVLAVVSGVSYAGVFMMNSFKGSDSLSSILIGQLLSVLIGIWFVFGETDFSITPLLCILLLGVFQLGLSYICMAKGLERTNAVTASLTSAIEPILNPVWVAVFWHEMINPLAILGAALVIGAVVGYNWLRAKKKALYETAQK